MRCRIEDRRQGWWVVARYGVTPGELLTLPQWCAIVLTVTAAMGSALTGHRDG